MLNLNWKHFGFLIATVTVLRKCDRLSFVGN